MYASDYRIGVGGNSLQLHYNTGTCNDINIPGRKNRKRDKIDPGSFAVFRKIFSKICKASYFACRILLLQLVTTCAEM